MPSEIELYRALVRSEGEALFDQLMAVDREEWSRPTACAGWDVLDVLVHLTLGTEFHLKLVANTLAGEVRPPWGDTKLPLEVAPSDYYRRRHRDSHANGPDVNLTAFREQLGRYVALLDRATESDLDRPGWFYVGEAPLRVIVAARTFDLILHGADIRRPLGIQPTFSPEGRVFAGKYVSGSLSQFWKPELAEGAMGTIRQEVDGDTVHVVPTAEGLRFAPPDGPTDAQITTDGGTWALLTWRKLPLAEAEAAKLATVTGDRALVERFLGAFRTP
jgi:uncharacterized protein (TIGR03083 family)